MRTLPDTFTEIRLPGGTVTVDSFGYLTDPDLWTPEFAAHVAAEEGIALDSGHFDVIGFMRDWQAAHGVAPDQRFVLGFLGYPDRRDKRQAKDALYALFPKGYVKQACRIAGMRQPRAWSTG